MVQAYNFLASWQLFPEKGSYERGDRPLSGTYHIRSVEGEKALEMEINWVDLQRQGYSSRYRLVPDGRPHSFEHASFADSVTTRIIDGISMESVFMVDGRLSLTIRYEIMPNGYMRITRSGSLPDGGEYSDVEYYHKQMSVLPYSASVAGAVIRPTEEGVIRHKALTAMEEQTNMQLEQIRKQIELLALQAHEIQKRKELSQIIYAAKLSFSPVIGQTYFLYERGDGSHLLSMISPAEWGGGSGPFSRFIAGVKLLADHTWMEVL